MAKRLRVLISSYAGAESEPLASNLRSLPQIEVLSCTLGDTQTDPLEKESVDVLVHYLGDDPERDLQTLMQRPAHLRPTLLIIGSRDGNDPRIMRKAMQAGARDFITQPFNIQEVIDEIRKIAQDKLISTVENNALTAFISPKGGTGASSLAGAVAHAIARRLELPTLLLDLDLQFGSQYHNLDLHPEKGLKEALSAVEQLDYVALGGYVVRHTSGLHVLGALPSQVLLPGELADKRLDRLLNLLRQQYNQIVVDLPCVIDPIFSLIIERVQHVVVVLQQDFQNLRSGQKLIHLLTDELQVPAEHIDIVINRYDPKNSITVAEIGRALQMQPFKTMPSDFKTVNGAANLGVPVLEHAPEAPISSAILELAEWVSGHQQPPERKKGFIDRIRSALASKG